MNPELAKSSLAQWYATPLSTQAAHDLSCSAQRRLDKSAQTGCASFTGIMMQTISDWWLDANTTTLPVRGMHYATSQRKMALYYLIVGQLLMSCKMNPVLDYLDRGLRYADGLISASDYFTVYNRHEELRYLTISGERQKAHNLAALLNESRVIRKLTHHNSYSIPKK